MHRYEPTLSDRLQLGSRCLGLCLLAVGVFCGYQYLWSPVVDALAHRPKLELDFRLAFAALPAFGHGISFLLLGNRAFDFFGEPEDRSVSPTTLTIILVAAGAACAFGVEYFARRHGYQV